MADKQITGMNPVPVTNKLEHFIALGQQANTEDAAMQIIKDATSEPGLLAFQELLDLPAIQALSKSASEDSRAVYSLFLIFAYGTWLSYRKEEKQLPPLSNLQQQKLRLLSVITLAEQNKILTYEALTTELEFTDVRELEDFLINSCIYTGSISGKLDQKQRYFEVENAVGRDLRPGQLDDIIGSLAKWLRVSDDLLGEIQSKLDWANQTSVSKQKHKAEVEDKVDEVKKNIRAEIELRSQQDTMMVDQNTGLDLMDEERPSVNRSKR